MITPLPQNPAGDTALVQTIRTLIKCVRERTIIPDPTIQVERTTQGTKVKAKAGKGGGGGSTAGDLPVWL